MQEKLLNCFVNGSEQAAHDRNRQPRRGHGLWEGRFIAKWVCRIAGRRLDCLFCQLIELPFCPGLKLFYRSIY